MHRLTNPTGQRPGIGRPLTCGHHTHTDRQFLGCLAAAWGMTIPQLEATFLALLLSNKENALATSRVHPPVTIPAPAPVPRPVKRRRSGTAGTGPQRRAVVRTLLARRPDATGSMVRTALADAGYDVSDRTAYSDLAAVRAGAHD